MIAIVFPDYSFTIRDSAGLNVRVVGDWECTLAIQIVEFDVPRGKQNLTLKGNQTVGNSRHGLGDWRVHQNTLAVGNQIPAINVPIVITPILPDNQTIHR